MNPTPIPWSSHPEWTIVETSSFLCPIYSGNAGVAYGRGLTFEQARINAEFIVNAVNCHVALYEALKALKVGCRDILLPSINEAQRQGFKMETWLPEQMQWSKAMADTDEALNLYRP